MSPIRLDLVKKKKQAEACVFSCSVLCLGRNASKADLTNQTASPHCSSNVNSTSNGTRSPPPHHLSWHRPGNWKYDKWETLQILHTHPVLPSTTILKQGTLKQKGRNDPLASAESLDSQGAHQESHPHQGQDRCLRQDSTCSGTHTVEKDASDSAMEKDKEYLLCKHHHKRYFARQKSMRDSRTSSTHKVATFSK